MQTTRKLKYKPFHTLILHEDEHLLIVNKPPGVSSLADKEHRSLQEMAQAYHPTLQLCHRLDKPTSGALLMAKDPDTYREISMQFQKRQVTKHYHTVIQGIHHFDQLEIDLPLLVSTNKLVRVNKQEGKTALTRVSTLRHFRNYTLLQCEPVTGRMHQIRVHLSSINSPILGDTLYGGKNLMLSRLKRSYQMSNRKEERPINHGFLLHAQQLSFSHPHTEEALSVEAPYPKNFRTVLQVLEKYNS